MKSSSSKRYINEKKKVTNSSQHDKESVSDDVFRLEWSEEKYATKGSQINYSPYEEIIGEKLSDKPNTHEAKNSDKLEGESHHLVKLNDGKIHKTDNQPSQQITTDPFYIEMYSIEEEINEIKHIVLQNIEKLKEKREDFFASKLNYTKDGYLFGRLLKIEDNYEIVYPPDILFSHMKIKDPAEVVNKGVSNSIIEKNLENFQNNSSQKEKETNNLSNVHINMANSDNDIKKLVQSLDHYYNSWKEVELDKVYIGTIRIDFSNEVMLEDNMHKLKNVITCLSNFHVFFLEIWGFRTNSEEAVERIFEFLRSKNVGTVSYYKCHFYFNLLWTLDQPQINTKCLLNRCVIDNSNDFSVGKQHSCIFSKINFVKWLVKGKEELLSSSNDSLINFQDILNNYLSKVKNIPFSNAFQKRVDVWASCQQLNMYNHHWRCLKFIKKLKYKVQDGNERRLVCKKLMDYKIKLLKHIEELKNKVDAHDDKFLFKFLHKTLPPQFTMDFNLDPIEKVVLEVSTMSMHLCDLIKILQATTCISSCLLHMCALAMGSWHKSDSIDWHLDELYLDNCYFSLQKEGMDENSQIEWSQQIVAIELFLEQMAEINFKDNFQLYFEDKDVFFNIWNVIMRNNWEETKSMSKIEEFKKYVSKNISLNGYDVYKFDHKLNLFSYNDIKKWIQIQQDTSLLLKSTKLVIMNSWVTEPMFYLCITQKEYFSEVVFDEWVVHLPVDGFPKNSTDIKSIEFNRWCFYDLKYMEESTGMNLVYDDITCKLDWNCFKGMEHREFLETLLWVKRSIKEATIIIKKFLLHIGVYQDIKKIQFDDCEDGIDETRAYPPLDVKEIGVSLIFEME
jgi:hypothetical protein